MKQLEQRYRWPLVHKDSQKVREGLGLIVRHNLTSLRRMPDRPMALNYFEEILTTDKRLKELQNFNGKIVGIFCNFVPEELIYATGAIPLRLCAGLYETISPAEDILPRDICPLIKSSLGTLMLNLAYAGLCHQLILPTPCDAKKKLATILNEYLPVWIFELPQIKHIDKSMGQWLAEVRLLKDRLESLTGIKISGSRLKETINLLHKRTETFRRLHQIRKSSPPVINGRDTLLVIQSAFYDDPARWIEKTNQLCNELETRQKQTPAFSTKTKRLLITGSPIIWPNYKILNIIEELDAVIVSDELCSGTRYLYDPVEVDEWTMDGMLRALATKYLYPSTCPCFIQTDDRIDKILHLVNEFNCQGVVYHNLRLCQLYDIEQVLIKKILGEKKIPMLILQTDYSQEDLGPLKTRVEAFLEMLQ